MAKDLVVSITLPEGVTYVDYNDPDISVSGRVVSRRLRGPGLFVGADFFRSFYTEVDPGTKGRTLTAVIEISSSSPDDNPPAPVTVTVTRARR